MLKNRLIGVILGIVVITMLSQLTMNCFAKPEKDKRQKEDLLWGEANEVFFLSLSLKNREVSSGQPVLVTVRIKNVSDKELRLVETEPAKDYSFIVTDSDGKAVPQLLYQRRLRENKEEVRRTVTTVAPGQVVEHGFNLSRRFDLTLDGKYSIQAERSVLKSAGDGTVALLSNIEAVTIR